MSKKLRHVANGGAITVGDEAAKRLIATLNWEPYGDTSDSAPEDDAEALKQDTEGTDTPEPVEEPEKASERPDIATVRAWAKENDVPVSDKGRVAESVYDKYAEAHKS